MNHDLINDFKNAKTVAIITGAGISAESGIPTFRGDQGLWKNFRAEDLATPDAFRRNPEMVWEWYDWRRGKCAAAEPNAAHVVLAEMENYFDDFLIITQNVDGLHRRAGSKNIIEIHGSIWKARCTQCGNVFASEVTPLAEIPLKCQDCGGLARPDIVWFGESYDMGLLDRAFSFLSQSDLVLIIGTSGMVNMPLYLARHALDGNAVLVEINPEETSMSSMMHYTLRDSAALIMPELWQKIRNI